MDVEDTDHQCQWIANAVITGDEAHNPRFAGVLITLRWLVIEPLELEDQFERRILPVGKIADLGAPVIGEPDPLAFPGKFALRILVTPQAGQPILMLGCDQLLAQAFRQRGFDLARI